jgi:hypothetical protein
VKNELRSVSLLTVRLAGLRQQAILQPPELRGGGIRCDAKGLGSVDLAGPQADFTIANPGLENQRSTIKSSIATLMPSAPGGVPAQTRRGSAL